MQFCNHSHDYRPNRTPLSPLTSLAGIGGYLCDTPYTWFSCNVTSQQNQTMKVGRSDGVAMLCHPTIAAPYKLRYNFGNIEIY